jgi:hypothetical protein
MTKLKIEGNEKLFSANLAANFWRFGYAEPSVSPCVKMTGKSGINLCGRIRAKAKGN